MAFGFVFRSKKNGGNSNNKNQLYDWTFFFLCNNAHNFFKSNILANILFHFLCLESLGELFVSPELNCPLKYRLEKFISL